MVEYEEKNGNVNILREVYKYELIKESLKDFGILEVVKIMVDCE